MAKAGRKPLSIEHLNQLDREFHKGFHRLCFGYSVDLLTREEVAFVDSSIAAEIGFNREDVQRVRSMTAEQFWKDLDGRPFKEHRKLAAMLRAATIATRLSAIADLEELRREMAAHDKELVRREDDWSTPRGTDVWRELWQAKTKSAVESACKKWSKLEPRYRDPLVASEVVKHAGEFLRMKRDRRFPRSADQEKGRIAYLARGMAGAFIGRSPLTAIERLRKITHEPGRPMWDSESKQCLCWRCRINRHRRNRGWLIVQRGGRK